MNIISLYKNWKCGMCGHEWRGDEERCSRCWSYQTTWFDRLMRGKAA